ncbi:MAG: LytR family transcriptional regulator [Actinomyces sp.]|nr:MAG: LytR family transcriptional regulator [Actinomyces sp.]
MTPDLLVDVDADPPTSLTLGALYERQGPDAVRAAVERLTDVGFSEMVELDRTGLEALLDLVDPLPYFLADDLVVERGDGSRETWLARGRYELDATVAAELYAVRNPGEADANRIERQRRLWESWLAAVELADDPVAATLPFDEGLSPYLRALGSGNRAVFVPPLDPALVEPDERPFYVLGDAGEAWLHDTMVEMVPLPISPSTSARPSVRLLDGAGDPGRLDEARHDLVDAGAVITVMGNADSFDVARSVVRVHHLDLLDDARSLARAVDATVEIDENPDEPVDVTVILGTDRR